MAKIYEDNSFAIGNTPLVKLKSVTKNAKATVLAKIEGRNPAYSVKCRIGANMIWDAEKSGKLTKDKTIVEPTSGNTGIALAFTASARGYKLILTMPESMSIERRRVMAVLGAEIVLTEASKGMPGAIAKAKEIAESNPSQYFMPGQFDNPANPEIHFKTTGPEIWDDCDGAIDVLVAGVGTGGTITGVAKKLKEEIPKIKIVGADPEGSILGGGEEVSSYLVEGIGYDFIPDVLDNSLIDEYIKTKDEESFIMARRLIKEEGLLCGGSCGATMVAAMKAASKLKKNQNCLVILADGIRNYMTKFPNDSWMKKNGFEI